MTADQPAHLPDGAWPCPLCGRTDASRLHRFAHHAIERCRTCSLTFVSPPPDPAGLLHYADQAHRGRGLEETAGYFALHDPGDPSDPLVARISGIVDLLAAHTPGRRLLDVGCGNGDLLALAARRGWFAVGIDGSPAAAAVAGRRSGTHALAAAFPDAGLEPGSFDAVVMLDFLEHVVDPRATVAAARALLAPGGVLYVNSPNHRSLLCLTLDLAGHLPIAPLRREIEKYYHPSHPVVFDPASLAYLLAAEELTILAQGRNSPILGRFALGRAVRLALEAMAAVARPLGLEARLWALARRDSDQPAASGRRTRATR